MSFAPIQVGLDLLRDVIAPDLRLDIGRQLMVRVADVGANGRGTISLAGIKLDARLPADAKPGDELRLVVKELDAEQVVLQTVEDEGRPEQTLSPGLQAGQAQAMLADGGTLALTRRYQSHPGRDGGEVHTLALRYDAPNLGAVDLSFVMDGTSLRLALTAPPGASYEAMTSESEQLADVIAQAAQRRVAVSVTPRREPLEVFA